MKRILFALVLLSAQLANAQLATYSLAPLVGFGTNSPKAQLHVHGATVHNGPVTNMSTSYNSNGVVIIGPVNTTAATATTQNTYAGKVRIASGSTDYYITNSVVTGTNAIVLMTFNTVGGVALFGDAPAIYPTNGLLRINLVAAANTDCDVSWLIVQP